MKAIQPDFAPAKTFLALPPESRHILQKFIDNQEDLLSEDHRSRVNTELRSFWDRLVAGSSLKTAVFAGVLKELGLSSLGYSRSLYWADTVALPLICTTGHSPSAIQDARDFLLSIMLSDDDFHTPEHKTKPLARLRLKLFDEYVRRTQTFESNQASLLSDDMQIARHIEDTLIAFGQKRPKDLFNNVDDLVIRADTRLPALTLLNAFLQHQTPHLYLVIHTPLIEHLLKCLMNDTSTPILSVALKSLIMLVPHIPGSLAPHLPRLFLVYSRILCWEKFSELSTDEQRSLVTDDRLAYDEAEEDLEDVIQTAGIDLTWEKACPGGIRDRGWAPRTGDVLYLSVRLVPYELDELCPKAEAVSERPRFPRCRCFRLRPGRNSCSNRSLPLHASRTSQFLHFNHRRGTKRSEMVQAGPGRCSWSMSLLLHTAKRPPPEDITPGSGSTA